MRCLIISLFLVWTSLSAQTKPEAGPGTQVIVLGSGTPNADPDRFGPAVAIVRKENAYLVDCGSGVVRRAAAAERNGIPALKARSLKVAFITHLHSDHTVGYPDLILSPWVLGRTGPLNVYGPAGLQDMTSHILEAWKKDIEVRIHGLEKRPGPPTVQVHEIKPGVVYKDANITVTAFLVKHGSWDEAFGYRFEAPDRSVVISGDTSATQAIAKFCNGCDVLLHEMYDDSEPQNFGTDNTPSREYYSAFHLIPKSWPKLPPRRGPSCWCCITKWEREGRWWTAACSMFCAARDTKGRWLPHTIWMFIEKLGQCAARPRLFLTGTISLRKP
jgi:phosphoribosyl 1,2-cyclic phosphodiesterase